MTGFNKNIKLNHPAGELTVAPESPPVVIAEIGINHGGDLALAKEMILAAKAAGADYTKFQAFAPEDLVNRSQKGSELWQIFEACALTAEDLAELSHFCAQKQIGFAATPFGKSWVDVLYELKVPFFKVASGDIVNRFLLQYIVEQMNGKSHKVPVFMSCGAADETEIKSSTGFLAGRGLSDLVLLYCVSMYPTPAEKLHLSQIPALAAGHNCLMGFSDHTTGAWAAPVAAHLGARVFEKHFTTDSSLPFGDNAISVEPAVFQAMAGAVGEAGTAAVAPVVQPNVEEAAGNEWGRRGLYSRDGRPLTGNNGSWDELYKAWLAGEVDFARPRHDAGLNLFAE